MFARLSPAWLWLLVAVQLAIPSSYYLLRDDRDDERFAWRMFSAVRLRQCEVAAFETASDGVEREVDLPRALHASWIRSLERGRIRVIERFLAHRCQQASVRESALERRCKSATGATLPSGAYHFDCGAHTLRSAP